jgi:hypothetical protein
MTDEELLDAKAYLALIEEGSLDETEFKKVATPQEIMALRHFRNLRDGHDYASLINEGAINEEDFKTDQDFFKLQDFKAFNTEPSFAEKLVGPTPTGTGTPQTLQLQPATPEQFEQNKQAVMDFLASNITPVEEPVDVALANYKRKVGQQLTEREALELTKLGTLPHELQQKYLKGLTESEIAKTQEIEGIRFADPTDLFGLFEGLLTFGFAWKPAANTIKGIVAEEVGLNLSFIPMDRIVQLVAEKRIDPVTGTELILNMIPGGLFGLGRGGLAKRAATKETKEKAERVLKQKIQKELAQLEHIETQRRTPITEAEPQGTPITQEVEIETLTGAEPTPKERTKEIFGSETGTQPESVGRPASLDDLNRKIFGKDFDKPSVKGKEPEIPAVTEVKPGKIEQPDIVVDTEIAKKVGRPNKQREKDIEDIIKARQHLSANQDLLNELPDTELNLNKEQQQSIKKILDTNINRKNSMFVDANKRLDDLPITEEEFERLGVNRQKLYEQERTRLLKQVGKSNKLTPNQKIFVREIMLKEKPAKPVEIKKSVQPAKQETATEIIKKRKTSFKKQLEVDADEFLTRSIEDFESITGSKPTQNELLTLQHEAGRLLDVNKDLPVIKKKREFFNKAKEVGREEDALTILAKDKSIPKFANLGQFSDRQTSAIHPHIIELPEVVEMAKDLTGKYPKVAENIARNRNVTGLFDPKKGLIKLKAEIAKDPIQANRTISHEFGHIADWMDEKTLIRGNIFGSIKSVKNETKGEIITPIGTFKNTEIRNELKEVSAIWKPFDRTESKKYTSMRDSSRELYADAWSVLLNDPAFLQQKAPKFMKAFSHFLDRKPKVFAKYQEIINRIHGKDVVDAFRGRVRDSLKKTEDGYISDLYKSGIDDLTATKLAFFDRFEGTLKRVGKIGDKNIPDAQNPKFAIQEMLHTGSQIEVLFKDYVQNIFRPLAKYKLDAIDAGEYLLYNRSATERKELFNPLGATEKRSLEAIERIKQTSSKEQFDVLEKAKNDLHATRKPIIDKIKTSGVFNNKLVNFIENNKDYVNFDVQQTFDERYGKLGSKIIYEKWGTLNEIWNPLTTTMLKDLSLMYSVNRQIALRQVAEFMQQWFPSEIFKAARGKGGFILPPKNKAQGVIAYLDKGKMKAYYVPKEISIGFEPSIRSNPVYTGLIDKGDAITNPFRQLFVNKNPLWLLIRNPMRDFETPSLLLPKMNPVRFLPWYTKNINHAWSSVFGIPTPHARKVMLNAEVLSMSSRWDITETDRQVERMLRQLGLNPKAYDKKITGPILRLFDQIDKFAQFMERIPKFASSDYLEQTFPNMSPQVRREMVAGRGGSPFFARAGTLAPIYNNTWIYSNANKEGFRVGWEVMKKSPAAFAAKVVFMAGAVPAAIQHGAEKGMFNWIDPEIQTVFQGASEFDKTNYTLLPSGVIRNKSGLAKFVHYLKLPRAETSRFFMGMFRKMFQIADGEGLNSLTDLISFAEGQLPSFNPAIMFVADVGQAVADLDPYDWFRGKYQVPKNIWDSNSPEKWKIFAESQAKNLGLSVFVNLDEDATSQDVKNLWQRLYGYPIIGPFTKGLFKVTNQGFNEIAMHEIEKSEKANKTINVDANKAAHKFANGEKLTRDEIALLLLKPRQREKIPFLIKQKQGSVRARILSIQGITKESKMKALQALEEMNVE